MCSDQIWWIPTIHNFPCCVWSVSECEPFRLRVVVSRDGSLSFTFIISFFFFLLLFVCAWKRSPHPNSNWINFVIRWYKSVLSGRIFSQQRIYLFWLSSLRSFPNCKNLKQHAEQRLCLPPQLQPPLKCFKMEALFSVLCPVALLNVVYICSYLGSLCLNHCNDVTFSFDRAVIKVLVYQEQTPLNTENDS